ncbi:MAG: RNA polymerase sigma factor [Acidobacteriota bacterium]
MAGTATADGAALPGAAPEGTGVEATALAALDRSDPEGALRVLMDAYGRSIYRFCRQMVGDDALAEEVHQMTFVQAFEGFERFGRRASLRTWLFGIARHRSLDAIKIARRRRNRFHLVAEPPDVSDAAPAAEDRLANRALAKALERCLEALAPATRTAVLLRYREGISYPDMADLCDAKPATLQARVARAMPVLRRCLEDEGQSI